LAVANIATPQRVLSPATMAAPDPIRESRTIVDLM
jgi:hypothetical protein